MRNVVALEAIVAELAADAVARSAHTVALRVAALNHEALDDSVENQAVIEAAAYQ